MATFHPFPRLPPELRILIWEMTVEPRSVVVHLGFHKIPLEVQNSDEEDIDEWPYLYSPTPVPSVVHTCKEARKLKLYGLYLINFLDYDTSELDLQYIWLNPKIDMITMGMDCSDFIDIIVKDITRVRFECRNVISIWHTYEYVRARPFDNLKELYIDYPKEDKCSQWNPIDDYDWPCGAEHTFIVYADSGRTVNFKELKEEEDRERERRDRQYALDLAEWMSLLDQPQPGEEEVSTQEDTSTSTFLDN